MRYLLLSDIHSNLEALEAALRASRPHRCDGVLVLGDLVGYGADPNGVIDRVRTLGPRAIVRGNHDKVAAGLEAPDDFNAVARAAIEWTRAELTPDSQAYLAGIPAGPLVVDEDVEICHGSPVDEDQYLVAEADAARALAAARRRLCFFGHTHVAMCVSMGAGGSVITERPDGHPEREIRLDPRSRYLINPGAVGQPRDGDGRAAFGIVDTTAQSIMLYRVAYPVDIAQKKILSAGLPPMLAHRLGMGR